MSHESSILPSITSVINSADSKNKEEFTKQHLNPDFLDILEGKDEDLDAVLANVDANPIAEEKPVIREETIKMIKKHYEFIEASRNVTTNQFLSAAAQLCHMDTALAEHVWLALFPKMWAILEDDQRSVRKLYCIYFIFSRFIICLVSF